MAQKTQDLDPWLGGKTPRYTPKQRNDMIDASIRRNGHRGCNCSGCKAHGGSCPFWILPEAVDVHRFLTPQHGPMGPADHHLSNLDAFCFMCNNNTPAAYAQHTLTHTPTHTPDAAATLAALEARRDEIRDDATASAGTKLNLDHEPAYRRFMFSYAKKATFTAADAHHSARELSDTGRDAGYSYRAKLLSSAGPLTDRDPVTKKRDALRFKDPEDYRLSLDELEAKYPKEGRER